VADERKTAVSELIAAGAARRTPFTLTLTLPDWARFVAQHADGTWACFSEEPEAGEAGRWLCQTGVYDELEPWPGEAPADFRATLRRIGEESFRYCAGGKEWDCGHRHRTPRAALGCLRRAEREDDRDDVTTELFLYEIDGAGEHARMSAARVERLKAAA
jgi:hypothetical protein